MRRRVVLGAFWMVACVVVPVHAAILEGGNNAGGTKSTSYSAGNENAHVDANGNATADANYRWSVNPDSVELKGQAKIGVDGSITIGAQGQLGDDKNNVHGSGEVTLSAEAVAEIAGQFTVGPDGAVAKVDAKIGASVSAEGTIKGGVTIWGVPIDVVLTGAVSAGAEASAGAEFSFDPTTGKMKVHLEASAVLGVGAQGGIEVEIGVAQLMEIGKQKISELWDWLKNRWNGEDGGDPFDGLPESGNDSDDSKGRYQGLKPIKLK